MKRHWSESLVNLGACRESIEWARTQPSAGAACLECAGRKCITGEDMDRMRESVLAHDFSAGKVNVKAGDRVIVETERGKSIGQVVAGPIEVDDALELSEALEL